MERFILNFWSSPLLHGLGCLLVFTSRLLGVWRGSPYTIILQIAQRVSGTDKQAEFINLLPPPSTHTFSCVCVCVCVNTDIASLFSKKMKM